MKVVSSVIVAFIGAFIAAQAQAMETQQVEDSASTSPLEGKISEKYVHLCSIDNQTENNVNFEFNLALKDDVGDITHSFSGKKDKPIINLFHHDKTKETYQISLERSIQHVYFKLKSCYLLILNELLHHKEGEKIEEDHQEILNKHLQELFGSFFVCENQNIVTFPFKICEDNIVPSKIYPHFTLYQEEVHLILNDINFRPEIFHKSSLFSVDKNHPRFSSKSYITELRGGKIGRYYLLKTNDDYSKKNKIMSYGITVYVSAEHGGYRKPPLAFKKAKFLWVNDPASSIPSFFPKELIRRIVCAIEAPIGFAITGCPRKPD